MTTLTIETLTPAAFAPYGEAFDPLAVTTRADQLARLQNDRPAASPNLFCARATLIGLPHRFAKMECHPWSSQSFMPLGGAPLVVAVALRRPDGEPDLSTVRAFLASGQGFSYHAGIWHLPLGSLGAAVPVLGFMYEDGTPEDCVWADVAPHTLVEG